MITSFEQDEDEPFGTGMFYSADGKGIYTDDPETARRFVSTLPNTGGAKLAALDEQGGQSVDPNDSRFGSSEVSDVPTRGPLMSAKPEEKVSMTDAWSGLPGDNGKPIPGMVDENTPSTSARSSFTPPAGAGPGVQDIAMRLNSMPQIEQTQQHSRQVVKGRNAKNVAQEIDSERTGFENYKESTLDTARSRDEASAEGSKKYTGALDERIRKGTAEGDEAARALKDNQAEQQAVAAEKDATVDPNRVFDNMSTGGQIGTILLAVMFGGLEAGFTGDAKHESGFMKGFNKAREDDIQSQLKEIESGRITRTNRIAQLRDAGMPLQQAIDRTRNIIDQATMAKLGEEVAQAKAEGQNVDNAMDALAGLQFQQEQRYNDKRASTEDRVTSSDSTNTQISSAKAGANDPAKIVEAMVAGRDLAQLQKSGLKQSEYDAQAKDYAEKGVKARNFQQDVLDAMEAVGLRIENGKVVGDADVPTSLGAGVSAATREVGLSKGEWADKQARVEAAYSRMKRSDVMSMLREPSRELQDEFASNTDRPFLDKRLNGQMQFLYDVATRADKDSKSGYNPVVIEDFNRAAGNPSNTTLSTLRKR